MDATVVLVLYCISKPLHRVLYFHVSSKLWPTFVDCMATSDTQVVAFPGNEVGSLLTSKLHNN